MQTLRTILVTVVLVVAAFAAGYAVGHFKWKNAEKGWLLAEEEMKGKIGALEKELTRAKAREAFREIPASLRRNVLPHVTEKNFGLAKKSLGEIREKFSAAQEHLEEAVRKKFEFFLPALAELQKEADQMNPEFPQKTEELGALFEDALKGSPKSEPAPKG